MSGKLGFSQTKQKQSQDSSSFSRPYINTRYSQYDDGSKTLTLDPSIRTLQEEALGRSRGMMGNLSQGFTDYKNNNQDIRNRLLSNQSAFRQARVNPIAQAAATRRGELQSNIGLRQISGSSFADQSLSNLDFDTARQIGDASAIADAESLSAVTGLDKDMLNALIGKIQVEQDINGFTNEIAQQRLQQELSAMGMGTFQQGNSITRGKSQTLSGEGKIDFAMPGGKTG